MEEAGLEPKSILEASDQDLTTQGEDQPYADDDEDDGPEKRVACGTHVPSLTADGFFHAGHELAAMQAVADAITSEALESHEAQEDEDDGTHEADYAPSPSDTDYATHEDEPATWDEAKTLGRAAASGESLRRRPSPRRPCGPRRAAYRARRWRRG